MALSREFRLAVAAFVLRLDRFGAQRVNSASAEVISFLSQIGAIMVSKGEARLAGDGMGFIEDAIS